MALNSIKISDFAFLKYSFLEKVLLLCFIKLLIVLFVSRLKTFKNENIYSNFHNIFYAPPVKELKTLSWVVLLRVSIFLATIDLKDLSF